MTCWREWCLITWRDGPGAVLFLSGLGHVTDPARLYGPAMGTIEYAEIEWANYQIRYDSSLFRLGAAAFRLRESEWNFVAFVWESFDGKFAFWLNAIKSVGMGLFTDQTIARGKVLIGEQEGEDPQKTKNRFEGRITCLQMWKIFLQIHTSTHCTTRNAPMEENAIPCMRPTVCWLGPRSK